MLADVQLETTVKEEQKGLGWSRSSLIKSQKGKGEIYTNKMPWELMEDNYNSIHCN